VLVGIWLFAWRSGADPERLAALGYPGVFLVMFINGASILFPVPGQAAVLAGGALWNPLLVGIAAGLGNSTGELTNYLVGRAAGTFIAEERRPRAWVRLQGWLSRYGFLTILAIAAVPNPIFDAVSLISGSLGYPARRFWLACALGNSVKYAALAYLGSAAIPW
jgi:membrane protein YqaA with SNARE-associated domain